MAERVKNMNSQEIAYLIHFSRKEKNISQKKLGELTGISHQIISRYENGAEVPTEEKLQLILSVLDVSLEEVIEVSNEINEMFDNLLDDLFYRKADYEKYHIVIQENKNCYQQNYDYYKIMVMELIYHIHYRNNEEVNSLICSFEKKEIQDQKILQIYYEYKGYYLLKKKKMTPVKVILIIAVITFILGATGIMV